MDHTLQLGQFPGSCCCGWMVFTEADTSLNRVNRPKVSCVESV